MNNKDDITCSFRDHTTKWILNNSFENYDPILKKSSIDIDNQKNISEVESLLDYFYKFKHTFINRKLVSKIFSNFKITFVFHYYQDSLFDVDILLLGKWYSKVDIERVEELNKLKAPLNSSILSNTLEKGSQVKLLIFSNCNNFYAARCPNIRISFSSNILTIKWYVMNSYCLDLLLELWPGLILRLEGFEDLGERKLDWVQRLLIYWEGSPLCWQLSFSKVVIKIDIDIDKIGIEYFKRLNKLKHLYDSLSKIYDVELENITYEDLLNNGSYFIKFIGRHRDEYNNEKLKFERILEYSRIIWYPNNLLSTIQIDGFNEILSELKLKEFEFYTDKIKLKRYEYNLVFIYYKIIAFWW